MANIVVSTLPESIEDTPVEMVERKGLGHPDSIMDGVMEAVSRSLSKYYVKHFGHILHHNTDKGQLSSGSSEPKFGGGKVLAPIQIQLSGQATDKVGNTLIPVQEIAVETARAYLHSAIPNMDIDEGVYFDSRIVMGSTDLREVYQGKSPISNDTSFGVGFAPFSVVENIVYKIENYLNTASYKRAHPEVGPDIKVMGLRYDEKLNITVAAAFLDSKVKNINEYFELRERLRKDVLNFAQALSELPVEVVVNNLDAIKRKAVYITVTGTSAEMGDAGAVGRGNRVNGLITPCRPMSLEAAAGKNPVRHVGKVYNLLANEMAKRIVKELPTVKECHVKLLGQIGRPIDDPLMADVKIISERFHRDVKDIEGIVERDLKNINKLITQPIIAGKLKVF